MKIYSDLSPAGKKYGRCLDFQAIFWCQPPFWGALQELCSLPSHFKSSSHRWLGSQVWWDVGIARSCSVRTASLSWLGSDPEMWESLNPCGSQVMFSHLECGRVSIKSGNKVILFYFYRLKMSLATKTVFTYITRVNGWMNVVSESHIGEQIIFVWYLSSHSFNQTKGMFEVLLCARYNRGHGYTEEELPWSSYQCVL